MSCVWKEFSGVIASSYFCPYIFHNVSVNLDSLWSSLFKETLLMSCGEAKSSYCYSLWPELLWFCQSKFIEGETHLECFVISLDVDVFTCNFPCVPFLLRNVITFSAVVVILTFQPIVNHFFLQLVILSLCHKWLLFCFALIFCL